MTKAYEIWQDRIYSDVFTKAQCSQWAKAVYAQAVGSKPGGAKTNLTVEEAVQLVYLMQARCEHTGGIRLEPEHEKQGYDWISRYGPKRIGFPQEVVDLFDHFTYQGRAVDISPSSYVENWVPVWRIHLTDGRSVDYYTASWQAGPTSSWWWVQKVPQPT